MTNKSKRKGKKGYAKRVSGIPTFIDRNLAAINPLSEQFEPTAECPVPQRKRMGGVS